MPRDILFIASAIKSVYEETFNVLDEVSDLTEMKMHKLLYFAQKQHYGNFGEWLFDDDFEGWVHGPVNRKVRNNFYHLDDFDGELTLEEEYTIREIIHDYGKYSAGVLRNLSHDDTAYKISRVGLGEHDPGNQVILKENMIGDIASYDQDDTLDCEVH
ncbi:Panacea domain-containing protein [Brevibacillus panacihumi]|uniref:Panacea domain-containing protein n=1 Tax=Brevibacillus panacihumi TaxID=497735 RepID=UPI003D1ACF0C